MELSMHHQDLPPKIAPEPEKKRRAVSCLCPYWEPENCSCLLVEDGLFLPVEAYALIYCLASQHTLCGRYERSVEQGGADEVHLPLPLNRRRSLRIPDRRLFRFSEITGTGKIPGIREDDAWTIDRSDHGIRFTTRQHLAPDTDLRFAMETGTTAEPLRGTGRVVWSEPLANTPFFHAAIAFIDCPAGA